VRIGPLEDLIGVSRQHIGKQGADVAAWAIVDRHGVIAMDNQEEEPNAHGHHAGAGDGQTQQIESRPGRRLILRS